MLLALKENQRFSKLTGTSERGTAEEGKQKRESSGVLDSLLEVVTGSFHFVIPRRWR